jgi:hypothetical protein
MSKTMAAGLRGSFILLGSPREGPTGPVRRGMHRCLGFPFAQVATGNLDIAVIGQLPTTDFPFGDEFKPGPVKVVRFKAPLRRRAIRKQNLENAPRNAYHTVIFADAYAEFDD